MADRKIKSRFSEVNPAAEYNDEKSLTQQHFTEDADINTIIARALKTGTFGDVTNARQPIFGDFTANDYQEMRNHVADVTQQFEGLPAKIRARFANDPLQLLRFVNDPRNLAESTKLGFIKIPQGFQVNDKGDIEPIPPSAPMTADPEANPNKKEPQGS
ncbi:MAG: internal scaffolding protein [Microvirus sp.]|nr:MAG: internal scaffolding protein [Microvirus sp.]